MQPIHSASVIFKHVILYLGQRLKNKNEADAFIHIHTYNFALNRLLRVVSIQTLIVSLTFALLNMKPMYVNTKRPQIALESNDTEGMVTENTKQISLAKQ